MPLVPVLEFVVDVETEIPVVAVLTAVVRVPYLSSEPDPKSVALDTILSPKPIG